MAAQTKSDTTPTSGKTPNKPNDDPSKTDNAQGTDKPAAKETPSKDETVPDNKTFTAPVASDAGKDPQPPRDPALSSSPENQLPGGMIGNIREAPRHIMDMSAKEKLEAYLDTFTPSSQGSRVVFGSVNVPITMDDLRELAGRPRSDES